MVLLNGGRAVRPLTGQAGCVLGRTPSLGLGGLRIHWSPGTWFLTSSRKPCETCQPMIATSVKLTTRTLNLALSRGLTTARFVRFINGRNDI